MNIDLSACAIGIEFGSTRIKAVLTGPDHTPLATGSYGWENRMEDGVWVYHLEDVVTGMRACYRALREDAERKLGCPLRRVGAIGISGMMHGYLVLGRDFEQIAPFRTWRNTITAQAAAILSARFGHNIPQRWCVAHLYQAILNGEEHVPQLGWLVTLSVYVHHLLTGRMVVGVGEASGMLAYNEADGGFDRRMVQSFDELIAPYGFPWRPPVRTQDASRRRAHACSMRAARWKRASRSVRRRATRRRAWSRPMRSIRAAAASPPERRALCCWCSSSR